MRRYIYVKVKYEGIEGNWVKVKVVIKYTLTDARLKGNRVCICEVVLLLRHTILAVCLLQPLHKWSLNNASTQ